jgi:hypothetical protein
MALFGNRSPNLSLSPGGLLGTSNTGTKNYAYDPANGAPIGSWSTTFTVTNNGTGTSNMLQVIGGDSLFVLSNDTCSGNALVPSGTCTFDITATAPAGCNPGDPFGPAPFVVNVQDNGSPYIFLTTFGICPF